MGDLDVGMKCVKYMLFITNFMFVMIGFLLISIGTTITFIYDDFDLFLKDHFFSPAALMVAIGIIIFFVAIFGCVGAIKESTCLVNTYGFFLFILLILEIAAIIAAFAMRGSVYGYVEEAMLETIPKYHEHELITESWDILQCRLQCCGVRSATDWDEIYISTSNSTVPASCISFDDQIYEAGCLPRLVYIISECALLIGTGGICVAIVQALGVVFASMLAKSIRRIKTEEERKRQENRMRLYEQLARGNEEKPTPVIYRSNGTEA